MNQSPLAYVVDLTEDPVVVGSIAAGQARVCTEVAGLFPWQVAVHDAGGGVQVWAGPICNTLQDGTRRGGTLLFEHLGRRLPRIEDAELQRGIVAGFWQALRQYLAVAAGKLGAGEHAVFATSLPSELPACELYLVVPSTYPAGLLDTLRLALNDTVDHCFMRHSFNELFCTIVYYIDNPLWAQYVTSEAALVTLLEGRSERDIRLLQMRCIQTPTGWDIKVLDHIQGQLSTTDFDRILVPGKQPHMGQQLFMAWAANSTQQHHLQGVLSARGVQRSFVHWQLEGATTSREVKVRGAMRLVQRCRGEGGLTIDIEHYRCFGVDFGAATFHEVIDRESVATTRDWPLSRSCTFVVNAPLSHSLRFNLCCGYSSRVVDALQLGSLLLPLERCRGLIRFEIVISYTLENPACGTATLSIVSLCAGQPALVDRTTFQLPNMVA